MKIEIKGYSGYYYDNEKNEVTNPKFKIVKIQYPKGSSCGRCKIKNDSGQWNTVQLSTIKFLTGNDILSIEGYSEIPFTNGKYFISEEGKIISFALNRCGEEVFPYFYEGKYPVVPINYKGIYRKVELHQLLCVTFYDKDYVEKGLVCMHLDNDKKNYKLSNLKIGTYSENNKQAYTDEINKGNGLEAMN